MSARAVLEFRRADEILQVPRDAIVRFPDGTAKVWIVTEAGGQALAASRDVQFGPAREREDAAGDAELEDLDEVAERGLEFVTRNVGGGDGGLPPWPLRTVNPRFHARFPSGKNRKLAALQGSMGQP